MTRLGHFWRFLSTNCLFQIAQIFVNFLGYFKVGDFKYKNYFGYFLANLGKFWVTLNSSIWSHCLPLKNFSQLQRLLTYHVCLVVTRQELFCCKILYFTPSSEHQQNKFTWFTNWFSFHRLLQTQETSRKYQLSPRIVSTPGSIHSNWESLFVEKYGVIERSNETKMPTNLVIIKWAIPASFSFLLTIQI